MVEDDDTVSALAPGLVLLVADVGSPVGSLWASSVMDVPVGRYGAVDYASHNFRYLDLSTTEPQMFAWYVGRPGRLPPRRDQDYDDSLGLGGAWLGLSAESSAGSSTALAILVACSVTCLTYSSEGL